MRLTYDDVTKTFQFDVFDIQVNNPEFCPCHPPIINISLCLDGGAKMFGQAYAMAQIIGQNLPQLVSALLTTIQNPDLIDLKASLRKSAKITRIRHMDSIDLLTAEQSDLRALEVEDMEEIQKAYAYYDEMTIAEIKDRFYVQSIYFKEETSDAFLGLPGIPGPLIHLPFPHGMPELSEEIMGALLDEGGQAVLH